MVRTTSLAFVLCVLVRDLVNLLSITIDTLSLALGLLYTFHAAALVLILTNMLKSNVLAHIQSVERHGIGN